MPGPIHSAIQLRKLAPIFAAIVVLSHGSTYAQPRATFELGKADHVELGSTVNIPITLTQVESGAEFGGLNFLIDYDPHVLTLTGVTPGEALSDCGWETFVYREDDSTACGGIPCSTGTVRIVALADNIDPPGEPACWALDTGAVAVLHFDVTSDPTLACWFSEIDFKWYGCTDNEVASKDGDSLFLSYRVYFFGEDVTDDVGFPTTTGTSSQCLTSETVLQEIDFHQGGVDIVCADSLDERGDINLNGQAYEISDWVLFSSFLLHGDTIFNINPDLQLLVSDVNANGMPAQLDDLVYLQRVIVGDAQPFPRPSLEDDALFLTNARRDNIVSFAFEDSVRALYFKFDSPIDITSDNPNLDWAVTYDSTRVLVTSGLTSSEVIEDTVLFTYAGDAQIVEAYASFDGLTPVPVEIVNTEAPVQSRIEPGVMTIIYSWAIDSISGTVYIGNLDSCSVGDIDPGSVMIDGAITTHDAEVVNSISGFDGEVLKLSFDARELAELASPMWDTLLHTYTVSWSAPAGCLQEALGEVMMIGKLSGDVNIDGSVDVADVVDLIGWLFLRNNPMPERGQLDIDGDGRAAVGDLVRLLDIIYR